MTTAAQTIRAPAPRSVLVASPNSVHRKRWIDSLHRASWPTQEACGGADALDKLELNGGCRLLLLDQKLPDLDTEELVGIIESRFPTTDVVLLDAKTGRAKLPPELTGSPVYCALASFENDGDFMSAPASPPAIQTRIEGQPGTDPLNGMVGSSPAMQQLYRLVRLVAPRETTVLITGESGTGKELVAEAIHRLSPRSQRPLVTVNCAAIPESLLEAELFGHTRGAFTGAVQARVGKIHSAQGGTLFLDEIGEMPPVLQAKLLRFLENREVQRLGSSDTFRVDVRVLAATNARLQEKVAAHEFRQDLFYRLAVFPIETPPLRARGEDVQELTRFFINQFCDDSVRISNSAAELLSSHDWPGNVRELRHAVERASILLGNDAVLLPEHFSLQTFPTPAK